MLKAYRQHVEERAAEGVVPKPLNAEQVNELVELFKNPPAGEEDFITDLLENRIPAGVDDAAYVKAAFLAAIAKGEASSPIIDKVRATELLGTMLGGYNIEPLISLLDDDETAATAASALSKTLLMFDAFHDVVEKSQSNEHAMSVLQSWANAEWFLNKDNVPEKITVTVFMVDGETNTDDLSPAGDAWSRPDIPLHAKAMLIKTMDRPLETIEELKKKGHPIAYVGDVVGTGSSRKSATNSVLWLFGDDIPAVPNKRAGGFCFGAKIAPIFFNTMEDAGALPIEMDVSSMHMGDVITIIPYEGKITNEAGDTISEFELSTPVLLDEVRAGGRIPLIIGRGLTERSREHSAGPTMCLQSQHLSKKRKAYTLAQKMVGKACWSEGVRPGTYCEPRMTTVGSQDTTGPMTRDELKDLACLGFSADLRCSHFVIQRLIQSLLISIHNTHYLISSRLVAVLHCGLVTALFTLG